MNRLIAAVLLYMLASTVNAAPIKENPITLVFPGNDWYQVETAWVPGRPHQIVCNSAVTRTCRVASPGRYKWLHRGESGFVDMGPAQDLPDASADNEKDPEPVAGAIFGEPISCMRSLGNSPGDAEMIARSVNNYLGLVTDCVLECPEGEILIPTSCGAHHYPTVDDNAIPTRPHESIHTLQSINPDNPNVGYCEIIGQTEKMIDRLPDGPRMTGSVSLRFTGVCVSP